MESRDGEQDPVAGKTVAEIFGEIVWLMTQHPAAKEMPLKDLERLVMPAIILRQFHITYAPINAGHASNGGAVKPDNKSANLQPVAVELFALEAEVNERKVQSGIPHRVPATLAEWRSGKNRRIVLSVSLKPEIQ